MVLFSVMNVALEDIYALELKLEAVLEEFAALEFERALEEHFVLSSLRGLKRNLALGLEGSSKERADLNSKRV